MEVCHQVVVDHVHVHHHQMRPCHVHHQVVVTQVHIHHHSH